MRCCALVLAGLVLAHAADAREPDGRLGLLVLPNDTRPTFLTVDRQLVIVARQEAAISLNSASDGEPLSIIWRATPDGLFQGTCALPQDTPPGTYSLEAVAGDTTDHVARSVIVYDSFPKSYSFAHLTDFGGGTPSESLGEADFVVVTGDLTSDGRPEEIRTALGALSRLQRPTIVNPGTAAIASGLAEAYFGPSPFVVHYGEDAYLGHHLLPDSGPAQANPAAALHTLRRSIRAARWSIGLLSGAGPNAAMRDQLILFHDDPLDYAIVAIPAQTDPFSWGRTAVHGPFDESPPITLFEVDALGVRPIAGLKE